MRPIVKIGLIAPFEGLYRESGYAALDAMRHAMAECTPPGIDVLPLALDDSGDPTQAQRAAQKLLADPTVAAIVGPLLLEAVPAVATVITPATTIPWFIPLVVTPEGAFGTPTSSAWLIAQVDFIATNTAASRVLLHGLPPTWQLASHATVPMLRVNTLKDALATVAEGDALLWFGRPDVGARWFSALRADNPNVSFWLAEQAGLDVFAAHIADPSTADLATNNADHATAHWLLWTDSNYNQWSQSDDSAKQPGDAARYLTYRATCAALNGLVESQPVTPATWQLQDRPFKQSESQ